MKNNLNGTSRENQTLKEIKIPNGYPNLLPKLAKKKKTVEVNRKGKP